MEELNVPLSVDQAESNRRTNEKQHSRPHPECASQTSAAPNHTDNSTTRTQLTVELNGTGYREFLTGTVAELSRPGYITLELPPLENWSSTLSKLPSNVRQ